MPKLPQSLADVSTKSVPMPEGVYQAVIDEVEVGESKSKLPMVTITYRITEGEFTKRTLNDYMVLETKKHEPNEPGLRSLKRAIVAALGEDRANADDFDTDELAGQAVTLVVKQDSYEDEMDEEQISNKVKKVLPAQ
jgi:uncharacterized protein DUF669